MDFTFCETIAIVLVFISMVTEYTENGFKQVFVQSSAS